jgi:hypothetical protein
VAATTASTTDSSDIKLDRQPPWLILAHLERPAGIRAISVGLWTNRADSKSSSVRKDSAKIHFTFRSSTTEQSQAHEHAFVFVLPRSLRKEFRASMEELAQTSITCGPGPHDSFT